MNKLFLGAVLTCLLGLMTLATNQGNSWTMAKSDLFAKTMRLQFRAYEICLNSRQVPNRKTAEREIVAINEISKRFWPNQYDEARWRLMTLMLTEGAGKKTGKRKDPERRSYGPLHVKYIEAVLAATVFNITAGSKFIDVKKKGGASWFKEALRGNVKFAIECGAGYLRLCDDIVNNDWQRGLLIYKYGEVGFMKVIRAHPDRSLNELTVWVQFVQMRSWIDCLKKQIEKTTDDPCQCVKIFHPEKP